MYKKIFKKITNDHLKKSEFINNLYKSEDKLKQPHFIFSAENPKYPENVKYSHTHDQILSLLKRKGYNAEELNGHYEGPEKSIIVYNPSKKSIPHLMNLSKDLGQESSIYSDGHNHEMHLHGGPDAGKHVKGSGTTIHKKPPEDMFSTLSDGTYFSHIFNFSDKLDRKDSIIKDGSNKLLKKSESSERSYLAKNENEHTLSISNPDTTLIHFSPESNLKEIDPNYQGVGKINSKSKQGKPEHPTSFFYLENTKPESIVLQGAQKKYIAKLGSKKLYDIGLDKENIRSHLKEKAVNREINPGIFTRDDLDAEIKNRGYHGIYNSTLNDTMKNVVAMYYPVKVEQELKIHPNDFKETSTEDHHFNDLKLEQAKQHAKEHGEHDGYFLHNLSKRFSKKE